MICMVHSIVDQNIVQILSEIWGQTWWKLPPGVVYGSESSSLGRNKSAVFMGSFAKMERWSHNKKIAKVSKLGLTGLCVKPRCQLVRESHPGRTWVWMPPYVLSGQCSWDRHTCYKETSWGVSSSISSASSC